MNDTFTWSELNIIENALKAYIHQMNTLSEAPDTPEDEAALLINDITYAEIVLSKVTNLIETEQE
jgi:hypothetical protein